MEDFKFFQKGKLDDPQMMNESTYITASFNDDTPEGHMGRRMLFYTDNSQYDRLTRQRIEDQERQDRIVRRINSGMSQEEILRRRYEAFERNGYYGDNRNFFSPVTVTKVKETFWTKFKDVMRESWRSEPVGIVFVGVLTTLITIVAIAKLIEHI